MIKYFSEFINESNSDTQFDEIKSELKDMIESSLDISGHKSFDEFISDYIKNDDDIQIEGLVNDSDVYDFYLKYRNDIDEILSEIKFYDEVPSEIGSFSLYDYVIKGTNKAIHEVVEMIISN